MSTNVTDFHVRMKHPDTFVLLYDTLTRSSALRRESAHLTWLYYTMQKAFHMKPAWITSVTVQRSHLSNEYKTKLQTLKAAALLTACNLSLTHSFRVNP